MSRSLEEYDHARQLLVELRTRIGEVLDDLDKFPDTRFPEASTRLTAVEKFLDLAYKEIQPAIGWTTPPKWMN